MRGLISLTLDDPRRVDPQLVQAFTHEGVATETAGVFCGYTIWDWDALCAGVMKSCESLRVLRPSLSLTRTEPRASCDLLPVTSPVTNLSHCSLTRLNH